MDFAIFVQNLGVRAFHNVAYHKAGLILILFGGCGNGIEQLVFVIVRDIDHFGYDRTGRVALHIHEDNGEVVFAFFGLSFLEEGETTLFAFFKRKLFLEEEARTVAQEADIVIVAVAKVIFFLARIKRRFNFREYVKAGNTLVFLEIVKSACIAGNNLFDTLNHRRIRRHAVYNLVKGKRSLDFRFRLLVFLQNLGYV